MGKSTGSKSEVVFEEVEQTVEEQLPEVKASESENYEVKDEAVSEILIRKVDRFISLLEGKTNVDSSKYGEEQLMFMGAIEETQKQEYSVFAKVMDHLVNAVRVNKKAFAMDRLFVFADHADVHRAKSTVQINRYKTYMSACVTLGNNLRDRARVGRHVDITMLTKGYHPKVALNVQNYFTRTYS